MTTQLDGRADSDAWDELEAFLAGDRGGDPPKRDAEPPDPIHSAYRALEIPEDAGPDEVRRAYRAMMVRYHPDRHASNPELHATASELVRRLTEAYQLIMRRMGV